MKNLLLILLSLALVVHASALDVPEPAREFRGAWVATVFNLDWPSKPGLNAEAQKAELRAIFDRVAAIGLNAVVFQVRPSCDALYASKREPWSAFLTGKQGVAASYDPLEFAVQEAHARGLELHAWFNPFRALASVNTATAENHITKTHPEWIRRYGNLVWVDPGEPAARRWSLDTILDVVKRYDVDGIHIDDYFYPYPLKGAGGAITPFPDDAPWNRYQQGGGKLSRDDWRRDNINGFVRDLYNGIKAEKRWVKFGISPFGIWRPRVPETVQAQLDSYSQLYADSRLWLQQGWCDYFSPQLYWPIEGPQSFTTLLKWWSQQNGKQRHLWPGLGTERVGAQRPAVEMVNEVSIARDLLGDGTGHVHWSQKALRKNQGGVADLLRTTSYPDHALIPASGWLSDSKPTAPKLTAEEGIFSWRADSNPAIRWWAVQTKSKGKWRLQVLPASTTSLKRDPAVEAIAVRAVDRASNTSSPAAWP